MARIIIAGDALIVESAHTLETIKLIERYKPKALALFDEDGKTAVFKVGSTTGKGSINAYGASFNSVSKNAEKKAIITLEIPAGTEDVVAYAEDLIGSAIVNLNKVEAQFDAAVSEITAEREQIRSNITVM